MSGQYIAHGPDLALHMRTDRRGHLQRRFCGVERPPQHRMGLDADTRHSRTVAGNLAAGAPTACCGGNIGGADRVLGIVLCRHRNRRSVRTAAVRCPRLGMVARMQHPVPDIIIRLPGDTGLRRFFHRPLCRPVLPLLRNIPDCIRLYPAPPGPRMTKLTEFRM